MVAIFMTGVDALETVREVTLSVYINLCTIILYFQNGSFEDLKNLIWDFPSGEVLTAAIDILLTRRISSMDLPD
jgi:hypothetical protein